MELFCECNNMDCLAKLPITDDIYLSVKKRYPHSALVLPGHQDPDDKVLEFPITYVIVED